MLQDIKLKLIKAGIIVVACCAGMFFLAIGGSVSDEESSGGSSGGSSGYTGTSDDILHDWVATFENSNVFRYCQNPGNGYDNNHWIYDCVDREGKNYKCYSDGGRYNNRNFGYGVLHYSYNGDYWNDPAVKYYPQASKELTGTEINIKEEKYLTIGTTMPIEITDKVMDYELQDLVDRVIKEYKQDINDGSELEQYKIHAVVQRIYKSGPNVNYNFNSEKPLSFWSSCKKYTTSEIEAMSDEEIKQLCANNGGTGSTTWRNQAGYILYTTGIYITGDGVKMNPEDYQNSNTIPNGSYNSFENFLFLGDSFTVGLGSTYGITYKKEIAGKATKDKFENAYFYAKEGVAPNYWIKNINNLPENNNITAVCVLLGLNNVTSNTQIADMKDLITKLEEKYPDKPIYVQKVFPVHSNYNEGGINAESMNKYIKKFNTELESYCKGKENVAFIDATGGNVGADGYLKNNDGYHLNSTGKEIWGNELKKLLLTN